MFSRDYDAQWIRNDIRTQPDPPTRGYKWMLCPKCKRDSIHIGPMGLYCEEGDCEWEQEPGPDDTDA
jgi:hypothetical protein